MSCSPCSPQRGSPLRAYASPPLSACGLGGCAPVPMCPSGICTPPVIAELAPVVVAPRVSAWHECADPCDPCAAVRRPDMMEANMQAIQTLRCELQLKERELAAQPPPPAAPRCNDPAICGSRSNQRRIDELKDMLARGSYRTGAGGGSPPRGAAEASPPPALGYGAGVGSAPPDGLYGAGSPGWGSRPTSPGYSSRGLDADASAGSPTGLGGFREIVPGWGPRTEWEKWDAKARHNPQLVTPEELGYQVAVDKRGKEAAYGRSDFRPTYAHEGAALYSTTA